MDAVGAVGAVSGLGSTAGTMTNSAVAIPGVNTISPKKKKEDLILKDKY